MLPLLLLAAASSPNQGWQPVPLITADQRLKGFQGGEGGQWPRSIACDSTGKFLVLSIDVAGMYRSFDGGITWEPCNVGYDSRGSAFCAIDPHNSNRIISVGVNSSPLAQNGLYLSEDTASSWRSVLPVEMGGDEHREQIAYDPSSYDPKLKETRRILWSRIKEDKPSWGPHRKLGGLFQSQDGGRTWKEVLGQEALGGAILRFDRKGGSFYAGTDEGLWKVDAGTFAKEKVLNLPITGLDLSAKSPAGIWTSTSGRLLFSSDEGRTWKDLPVSALAAQGRTLRGVKASPADPKRISVWSDESPNGWNWPRYVSHDGGLTWTVAVKRQEGAFLPDNTRQGFTLWHPLDPKIAWGYGGDWPTRSVDGGKTFTYSGQGVNAVMVGGLWSFSKSEPNLIFVGSQDYNGAFTLDSGRTWKRAEVSGNAWGGFTYGGYALNRATLLVGEAESWGASRRLRTSHDGGVTWKQHDLVNKGLDVSTGWSRDPKRVFLGSLFSEDGAASWRTMDDCDGVLAESDKGVLFGVKRGDPWTLASSQDGGRSWKSLAPLPQNVTDMAWDPAAQRLFIAADLKLWQWQESKLQEVKTLLDQFGQTKVRSVAVDPKEPSVVYVGSAAHLYSSSVAVQRSLDGGRNWSSLTLSKPLAGGQKDGGREADVVRVHPLTRRLFVSTSCYGIWSYPAP